MLSWANLISIVEFEGFVGLTFCIAGNQIANLKAETAGLILGVGMISDIIFSNLSAYNRNKISEKFERFLLKADINNIKSNFGIVYKF